MAIDFGAFGDISSPNRTATGFVTSPQEEYQRRMALLEARQSRYLAVFEAAMAKGDVANALLALTMMDKLS